MERQSGIYKIQSKINPERIYIGSAVNITKRWSNHLCYLQKNTHHSSILQNHVNKYGLDDLQFSVIEPCFPEFLIEREQYYLNKLKPKFNVRLIAESCLGHRHSKETKNKMREIAILKNAGDRFPHEKGRKLSKEQKQHLSNINKGHKHSDETKRKMSEKHKGNKYNLGRKKTEKEKNAIREWMLTHTIHRIPLSEERKKKMMEGTIKNKVWERNIGKVRSIESRKKISEGTKKGMLRKKEIELLNQRIATNDMSLCN